MDPYGGIFNKKKTNFRSHYIIDEHEVVKMFDRTNSIKKTANHFKISIQKCQDIIESYEEFISESSDY